MCPSTKEEEDKEKKKAEGKEPPTGLSVSCYKLWQAHFPKSGTHIYVLLSIQVSEKEENVCSGWLKLITSFSFCSKFCILTNLYHESLFICPFFDTNNFSQLQFKLSIFTREHFSCQEILFSRFLYKSSAIVFHQNNFFELRWDYTSNIVSLQCRFFVSIPSISNFQDKVKVARLDLFFLCVFPAFYVGFLLAYWIHFINRFLSIFKWAPENYENMETFLYCLQVL